MKVVFLLAAAAAAYGGTFVPCPSGTSAPGAVVGQGNCTVDDKAFGTIGYVSGTVPSSATVRYFEQTIGTDPYYTVQFAGNLNSAFSVDYTIAVTDPKMFIDRITADISNPAQIGNPYTTKVVDQNNVVVGTLTATATQPSGVLTGHWTQLHITDSYFPQGGAATSFGNTFHQSTAATPEPATAGIGGAGLLLVMIASRLRKRSRG